MHVNDVFHTKQKNSVCRNSNSKGGDMCDWLAKRGYPLRFTGSEKTSFSWCQEGQQQWYARLASWERKYQKKRPINESGYSQDGCQFLEKDMCEELKWSQPKGRYSGGWPECAGGLSEHGPRRSASPVLVCASQERLCALVSKIRCHVAMNMMKHPCRLAGKKCNYLSLTFIF